MEEDDNDGIIVEERKKKDSEDIVQVDSSDDEDSAYNIRPPFKERFNPVTVKDVIRSVLIEMLGTKPYNSINPEEMGTSIGRSILEKLKVLPYDRYKLATHVVIAEHKGQAMKMASLCNWDSDTDNYAYDMLITESVICIATVFGVYYY